MPGFKVLFEEFPDSDWYIMIDDDTYMFMENLVEALKNYDPDKDYYFGSSTVVKGCSEEPINFAYGGAGIVLSRSAMKKIIDGFDGCMSTTLSCQWGDARLGLCLFEHGVIMSNELYSVFYEEPPNAMETYFPSDSCINPLTFHHMLPHQTQTLFELETKMKTINRMITYGHVFWHMMKFYNVSISDNMYTENSFRGEDHLKVLNLVEKTEFTLEMKLDYCRNECYEAEHCYSFVFDSHSNECYLKRSIDRIREGDVIYNGIFTGIIFEKYRCHF